MNLSPTTRLSRNEVYPTVYVQDRYSKLTYEHIEQVLDGIRENTSKVMHTKAYLMKCLFNAVISKYLEHRKSSKANKAQASPVIPYGEQAVKQLIGQEKSGVDIIDPIGRINLTNCVNKPGQYSIVYV